MSATTKPSGHRRKKKTGTRTAAEREALAEADRAQRRAVDAARPKVGAYFVEAAMACYRIDREPLFLWDAFAIATDHAIPVPREVQRYLRECAYALTSEYDGSPTSLKKALGLHAKKGPGNVQRYKRRMREVYGPTLGILRAYAAREPGYETQGKALEKLEELTGKSLDARAFRRLRGALREAGEIDFPL